MIRDRGLQGEISVTHLKDGSQKPVPTDPY